MMRNDVCADLRARIAAGQYRPGEPLPPTRALMATYGVSSKATLDLALRDLEAEGLITRKRGSGIYVRHRSAPARDLIAGLRMEHRRAVTGERGGGLFEAMTGARVEVETTYAEIPPPTPIAAVLGLAPGALVLKRLFRYLSDGTPHQLATSYMPLTTAQAAGLREDEEVPGASTMAQLARAGQLVDHVTLHVAARMPSADETAGLQIPPGTPVFEHHRTMFAGKRSAETTITIVPADRVSYVFNVDLTEPAQ
jgi:GntR family transcriptional regulator